MPEAAEPLINVAALARFLDQYVPDSLGPLHIEKHVGGYSNETFYVTRGRHEWVLRRPPRGPLLPTAHDVLREYRFIAALDGHARVPRPVASCDDPAVIGAPFYLMERIPGAIVREQDMPTVYDTPAARRRISEEFIDGLVELHAVDWRAVGLRGRPESYLDRQIELWGQQWQRTRPRTRVLPGLDAVLEWLRTHRPAAPGNEPGSVVHGDYKLDNTIYVGEVPRLAAILDWEMATVGDPLADVGWLLSNWYDPDDPDLDIEFRQAMALDGFLPIDGLVQRYEAKSGRSMQSIPFYVVLAICKKAIILEGLYAGFLEQTASNPDSESFGARVPQMVRRAQSIIARW